MSFEMESPKWKIHPHYSPTAPHTLRRSKPFRHPAPRKNGSEQEFVNTCVFAGFLSDRLLGPPMLPHLLHVRCRQCFPTFCGSFHVRTWPQLLSGHNPLKGRLKRGSPGTEQLFPNREPVCPKASGRPADPSVKDRIVDIPQ